ncbi:MAG: hypothetical protein AAF702_12090 [Chloroflexota bacterium]
MYIEIGVPATLPLALVKLNRDGQERYCLLAATLAHPPVHLRAQAADRFTITGPRADVAGHYAQHLYDLTQPATLTEIEIEYAIPLAMGHGSETMLGLAVAHAMKYFNTPAESDVAALAAQLGEGTDGLSLWASQAGGLMLLDLASPTTPPLYRAEPDNSEKSAWGLVSILPRLDASLAQDKRHADEPEENELDEDEIQVLERERYAKLLTAAQSLDTDSGTLFTQQLWPAVEADDLESFGSSLSQLQQLTQEAMNAVGLPSLLNDHHRTTLNQMAESGAVACGQSLTGYGLFAFARGARATINMRLALKDVVDYSDGVMDATFIDSRGIRVVEREGNMKPPGTLLDKL